MNQTGFSDYVANNPAIDPSVLYFLALLVAALGIFAFGFVIGYQNCAEEVRAIEDSLHPLKKEEEKS